LPQVKVEIVKTCCYPKSRNRSLLPLYILCFDKQYWKYCNILPIWLIQSSSENSIKTSKMSSLNNKFDRPCLKCAPAMYGCQSCRKSIWL